ncbi:hypothetical protein JHL18_18905, partial [Clostridium sp. YIM B02505]|nr:hypothetical protein [Clostridium yunnanense]
MGWENIDSIMGKLQAVQDGKISVSDFVKTNFDELKLESWEEIKEDTEFQTKLKNGEFNIEFFNGVVKISDGYGNTLGYALAGVSDAIEVKDKISTILFDLVEIDFGVETKKFGLGNVVTKVNEYFENVDSAQYNKLKNTIAVVAPVKEWIEKLSGGLDKVDKVFDLIEKIDNYADVDGIQQFKFSDLADIAGDMPIPLPLKLYIQGEFYAADKILEAAKAIFGRHNGQLMDVLWQVEDVESFTDILCSPAGINVIDYIGSNMSAASEFIDPKELEIFQPLVSIYKDKSESSLSSVLNSIKNDDLGDVEKRRLATVTVAFFLYLNRKTGDTVYKEYFDKYLKEFYKDDASISQDSDYISRVFSNSYDAIAGEKNSPLSDSALEDFRKKITDQLKNASVARRYDPVVLDLNGDGISVSTVEKGVNFNLDDTGLAEKTQWIGPNDGFLARDLNGNGLIDSGRELFGDRTLLSSGITAKDGLEAIKDIDANKDNKIDINDSVYKELRIWQDSNSDGQVEQGELKTLEEAGITSINLASGVLSTQSVSNATKQVIGSFTNSENKTIELSQLLFNADYMNSKDNELIDINADVQLLPEINATGNVYSLRKAMTLDENLKASVIKYINNIQYTEDKTLITEILYRWTGSYTVDPSSRGSNIDARKLVTIEMFTGQKFLGVDGSNPNTASAPILNNIFEDLISNFTKTILSQTYLGEYLDLIQYKYDVASGTFTCDTAMLEKMFSDNINSTNYAIIFRKLKQYYQNDSKASTALNIFLEKTKDTSAAFYNIVNASQFLKGTDNEDSIGGSSNNDVLDGGAGNDSLNGGYGADTYIFKKGYGVDTINNSTANDYSSDIDVLMMGDINENEVVARRIGNDLELR